MTLILNLYLNNFCNNLKTAMSLSGLPHVLVTSSATPTAGIDLLRTK